MVFSKLAVDQFRQFGLPLRELRFGNGPVVLCFHLGVGFEVKAVGQVVARGIAPRLIFLLAQLHPGTRPIRPATEAGVILNYAALAIRQ